MKPSYKSSTFWLSALAVVLGALQVQGYLTMPGVPPVVGTIVGGLLSILGLLGYTTSRTILSHQDSAEAHALQMAASLAVVVPDAGAAKTDPAVKPATGVATGVASAAKGILLFLLASSLMSCAHYQVHSLYQGRAGVQELTATTPLAPLASDAQCQSWHNQDQLLSGAELVIGFLGGGSGLSTVIPSTSGGKEALAITSVVFGAATLALGVVDTLVKNEFSQSCALTAVP